MIVQVAGPYAPRTLRLPPSLARYLMPAFLSSRINHRIQMRPPLVFQVNTLCTPALPCGEMQA